MTSYQKRLQEIRRLKRQKSNYRYKNEGNLRYIDDLKEQAREYRKRIIELKESQPHVFSGGIKICLNRSTPVRIFTEVAQLDDSLKLRYMPREGKPNRKYKQAWIRILEQCPENIIRNFK